MKNINTPYDDVFQTLLNDCTELIIPVVNEIFGENYTGKERITFSPNEHFLNQQDGNTKEKITDSCFVIQGAVCKKYHYEENLREYNTNAEKMEELKKKYQEIRNRLELMCDAGMICEYTKCAIIDMSNKVVENLTARYANVREEVKAVMGGKVLDYEAKDILKRGIRQGLEEGLLSLVRDGLLSVEEAAKRLQMSESEFKKLLKQ